MKHYIIYFSLPTHSNQLSFKRKVVEIDPDCQEINDNMFMICAEQTPEQVRSVLQPLIDPLTDILRIKETDKETVEALFFDVQER